jgi:hypothetical protein
MIELDKYEKQWILMCKGQLKDKYPFTGRWHDTLKPLFKEIYGWDPDEDNNYHDYLHGMFDKLLDVFMKIKTNWSNENGPLKDVFKGVFHKGISNDSELPIERGIYALCGLIQCNMVVDDKKQPRYNLEL